MYTTCTECHRQFRIRADQLNAAEGQVMCGYCGNQFNALENLSDSINPTEQEQIQQTEPSMDEVLASIEQEIEEENIIQPVVEEAAKDVSEEVDTAVNLQPERSEKDNVIDSVTAAEILKVADSKQEQEEFEPELVKTLEKDDDLDSLIQQLSTESIDKDELDEVLSIEPTINDNNSIIDDNFDTNHYAVDLLDEELEVSSTASNVFWWLLGIILLLGLAAQYVWFQRDNIMQQHPKTVSYYNQLCAQFKCNVYRNKDFSKLQIINRDVRLHPAYQDSLLVNAVMENQGETTVPYPNIQLSLFDTNGEMVSYRRFKPKEYLEENINIAQGMAANSPVHFVMELSGYEDNAVSFEFDFY